MREILCAILSYNYQYFKNNNFLVDKDILCFLKTIYNILCSSYSSLSLSIDKNILNINIFCNTK
jgi:hypothetical protein